MLILFLNPFYFLTGTINKFKYENRKYVLDIYLRKNILFIFVFYFYKLLTILEFVNESISAIYTYLIILFIFNNHAIKLFIKHALCTFLFWNSNKSYSLSSIFRENRLRNLFICGRKKTYKLCSHFGDSSSVNRNYLSNEKHSILKYGMIEYLYNWKDWIPLQC